MQTMYFHSHRMAFVLAFLLLYSCFHLRATLLLPLTTKRGWCHVYRLFKGLWHGLSWLALSQFFRPQRARWLNGRLLAVILITCCHLYPREALWRTYHIRKGPEESLIGPLLLVIYKTTEKKLWMVLKLNLECMQKTASSVEPSLMLKIRMR